MTDQQRALNYMNYLAVDELLSLQRPVSDGPEHDELLFITIHQVYELWFKQLLHEIEQAQREMDAVRTQDVLATLNRVKVILAVCIRQVDVLVTMTPLQFNTFRDSPPTCCPSIEPRWKRARAHRHCGIRRWPT